MQRHLFLLLRMALAGPLMAQTPWPPLCIQDADWTSGTHHTSVTQPIEAPCSPSALYSASASADVVLVSATEVHLADGFHAGDFSGNGQFHAHIDEALGAPADLMLITSDPATHIVDGLVHVAKWEKLEMGLRLPQAYRAAIDSFFVHYYPNAPSNYTSDPGNLDRPHDLNPYADDSLLLTVRLTNPLGVESTRWGFYMKQGKWSGSSGQAKPMEDTTSTLNPYAVHFRITPDMEGPWEFEVRIEAPHTTTVTGVPLAALHYTGYSFVCDPPLEDNHGYLQVNQNNRRVLQFEDGTPYFGLGVNMDGGRRTLGYWWDYYRHDFRKMKESMGQLSDVGGNFMRIMLLERFLAPEWMNLGVYDAYLATSPCEPDQGVPNMPGNGQFESWVFDSLLFLAREKDIYLQVCLEANSPTIGAEGYGWGNHPYVRQFLEPRRDTASGLYDVKEYFYTGADSANTESGVFYYWKRRYKYMLARWGWSVNLAVLEPFNEIDQMLTYDDFTVSDACDETKLSWPKDTLLPAYVSAWFTDMAHYVRDPVDTNDLAHSPLGDARQLFLASYAYSNPSYAEAHRFYSTFSNPQVDLIDAHMYTWPDTSEQGVPDHRIQEHFDKVQGFRDAFPYPDADSVDRKPIAAGELNHSTTLTLYASPADTIGVGYEFEQLFHNYDVSFHNELWSGAFSGKWATGTTWLWHRVFWWEGALQNPPPDPANTWQTTPFSNAPGVRNVLDLGIMGYDSIENKSIYHNFKPLADLLNNVNLQTSEFFTWDLIPHKVYDYGGQVECYYLMNDSRSMAIGWVHNLNAWGMNNFYLRKDIQNFLGCTDPDTQTVSLPGFVEDQEFHITWFPTRMNGTVPANDSVMSTSDGTVTLDFSDHAMHGIASNYLDTIHSDYAFVVAFDPVVRSMLAGAETDNTTSFPDWDFSIYPNPARETLRVLLPADETPRNIALLDLPGRQVYLRKGLLGPSFDVPIGNLAKGTYCVKVSDAMTFKMKVLIVQ